MQYPIYHQRMHLNARFFPYQKGVDFSSLKIHSVGAYSISRPEHADDISTLIAAFLHDVLDMSAEHLSIVDGTACVGGDTLSFIKYFSHVTSIERDGNTFAMLQNNIRAYKIPKDRISLIQGDVTKFLGEPSGDVLFLDPPWSEADTGWYTKRKSVNLQLSHLPIASVVLKALETFSLVVIKVPYNFSFRSFMTRCLGKIVVVARVHTFYILMCCNVSGKENPSKK